MATCTLNNTTVGLGQGQGVRAWKYGSIWGNGIHQVGGFVVTAPVYLADSEKGSKQMMLMEPNAPFDIDFTAMRDGALSVGEWAAAERYNMDRRGRLYRLRSIGRAGLLPLIEGSQKPGSSCAGFNELELSAAGFLDYTGNTEVVAAPLELPRFWRKDPQGQHTMWCVYKQGLVRVSPADVPTSFIPGGDFLSKEDVEKLQDSGWEARLENHLVGQGVLEVYYGYAELADHLCRPVVMSQQEVANSGFMKIHATPLFAHKAAAELSGDSAAIVSRILGNRPQWAMPRNHQVPMSAAAHGTQTAP